MTWTSFQKCLLLLLETTLTRSNDLYISLTHGLYTLSFIYEDLTPGSHLTCPPTLHKCLSQMFECSQGPRLLAWVMLRVHMCFLGWNAHSPLLLSLKAAAAAKSLQSCPTLCDPIDGSPPGSSVPGILQARTLEWVVISFSSAWKWSRSVVFYFLRPNGLQPTRLLCPWDFPGKSTGVGCHCLLLSKSYLPLNYYHLFPLCYPPRVSDFQFFLNSMVIAITQP